MHRFLRRLPAQSVGPWAVLSAQLRSASVAGQSSAPASASTSSAPPQQQQQHKISENVGDASYVGGEDIPFSKLKHYGYKAMHARRLLLPVACAAVYGTIGIPVLFSGSELEQMTMLCTLAVSQRLLVRGATNRVVKDLTGKRCVVTGGTSGLGLATAQQLCDMGACVIIISSKSGKEAQTLAHLKSHSTLSDPSILDSRVSFIHADFRDPAEVSAAVLNIRRQLGSAQQGIDILVNNAGALLEESVFLPKAGVEEHIAINFLSPYLLTEGLLPQIRKARGRVVYVTCAGHHGVRKGNVVQQRLLIKPSEDESQVTARCYSASKLGNVYHTQNLASRRYEGVTFQQSQGQPSQGQQQPFSVCCVDPGVSTTNLYHASAKDGGDAPLLGSGAFGRLARSLWLKDPTEGAQSIVNACLRDDLENGGFYAECRLMPGGLSRMANSPKEMTDVCRWAGGRVEKHLVALKGATQQQ